MNPITVRKLVIGEGRPKICVPVVARNFEEVKQMTEAVKQSCSDLVEWRADWFDLVFDIESVRKVLRELRERLGDMPILFTFRSEKEGGEKSIDYKVYEHLLIEVAKTGLADLIDVEIFMNGETDKLIQRLHQEGAKVLCSNHDFLKTPNQEEIVRRLCEMQRCGADISKLAVMPQTKEDVKVLLDATYLVAVKYGDSPIVTISMADLGVVSRVCGGFFGSAISFACAGAASAPGQLEAKKLRGILEEMYKA